MTSTAQMLKAHRWTNLCILIATLHVSITLAAKSRTRRNQPFLPSTGFLLQLQSEHGASREPSERAETVIVKEDVPLSSQKAVGSFMSNNFSTLSMIGVVVITVDALILALWMYRSKRDDIVDLEYEDQRYYGRLCEIIAELAGMLKTSAKLTKSNEPVFLTVIPETQNQQGAKATFHSWRLGSIAWWHVEADFEAGLEPLGNLYFTDISKTVVKKDTVRIKGSSDKTYRRSTDVIFASAKSAEVWGSTLAALIEQFKEDFGDTQLDRE